MIFIVNKDSVAATQLLAQLENINHQTTEVYSTAEETEQNLYKLPELVLIDESIELANVLYLTQSIKAYDASIQVVWLAEDDNTELKRMYASYGVQQCLSKGQYFLERLSLSIAEAKRTIKRSEHYQNRIEHLRKNVFHSSEHIPASIEKYHSGPKRKP